MTTVVRVLSADGLATVHEQTLVALETTGLRVDSTRARTILADAGATVDEATRRVRFPPDLVERSLAAAPRSFSLGGRRPGWSLPMNDGHCTLCIDGEAVHVLDPATGARRVAARSDWERATRLIDATDAVGVYWRTVEGGLADDSPTSSVRHLIDALGLFSKHIQDGTIDPRATGWLLEVLATVFGGQDAVRRDHPYSFLVCPLSPLVLEGPDTDAYLATLGWDVPIAVMPMPIMGLTAPVGLLSTIVLGNAEVLAMLCLVQAAAPGTPFIYAPALAVMDPRSGRWVGGAVEHALLGAAVTEVARGYGLPVMASTGGSDAHAPGIQAAFERATNWVLPSLAWPDILVGPGCLSGSTILSLEQLVIDLEVFRRCARLHRGISDGVGEPAEVAIADVGPGGDFIARTATRDAVHQGEWSLDTMGVHDTYERWDAADRPELLDQAREIVDSTIAGHQPLPLDEATIAELGRIEAAAASGATPPGVG